MELTFEIFVMVVCLVNLWSAYKAICLWRDAYNDRFEAFTTLAEARMLREEALAACRNPEACEDAAIQQPE